MRALDVCIIPSYWPNAAAIRVVVAYNSYSHQMQEDKKTMSKIGLKSRKDRHRTQLRHFLHSMSQNRFCTKSVACITPLLTN
jgi:hypothetical protein